VREAAARALGACLVLVAQRHRLQKTNGTSGLYTAARSMLAGVLPGAAQERWAPEAHAAAGRHMVHGALLVIGELLSGTGAFMAPKFNEICEAVMKHKDSRDRLVRRSVIVLLPRLAHFLPEAFARAYAEVALAHILSVLRQQTEPQALQRGAQVDRGVCYVALGRIALAVGSHLSADALRPQLERIVSALREGLTASPPGGGNTLQSTGAGSAGGGGGAAAVRRVRPFLPEALTSVAMLACAVGPALIDHMHGLLDPMCLDGLSAMLVEALHAVARAIPALRPLVQVS